MGANRLPNTDSAESLAFLTPVYHTQRQKAIISPTYLPRGARSEKRSGRRVHFAFKPMFPIPGANPLPPQSLGGESEVLFDSFSFKKKN